MRRRGLTLIEMISLLPMMGAFLAIAYVLAGQVERFQSHANAYRQKDAVVRDLVRRVQEDVEQATEARLEQADSGSRLSLLRPSGTVTYAAAGNEITRTDQSTGNPATRYPWKLDRAQMGFRIETVGRDRQIVWILCALELPFEQGEDQVRQLSAAATVGRGGAR